MLRSSRWLSPAQTVGLLAFCLVLLLTAALAGTLDAPDWLSVALFATAIAAVTLGVFRSDQSIDPSHVFVFGWTLSITFYYSRLIILLRPWSSWGATAYLLSFLACVVAGRLIWPALFHPPVARRFPHLSPFDELWEDVQTFRWLSDAAAVLGYISAISFAIEMLVFSHVDLSNLANTRAAFIARDPTILSQIALVGRIGAVVSLLLGIVFQSRLGRVRFIWYVGSGLSTITLSVLSAGRFVVLQVLMTMIFGLAIRRSMGQKALALAQYRLYAVVIASAIMGYMFYVSIARSDRDPYKTERYYLASSASTVGPTAQDLGFYRLPVQVQLSLISAYCYSAMPIGHFSIFWNVYDGSPQFGALNFFFFSHQLKKVDPTFEESTDILADRYNEFLSAGEGSATWQTGVRDWIIDFGETGSLIGAFLLGSLSGATLRRFRKRPTFGGLLRLAGLWMVFFHFPLYSIIGEPAVMTMVAAPWVLPFLRGASRRRPATGLEALRSAIPG